MPRESSGKSGPCGISQLALRYVSEDWPPEMASAKAARRSGFAGDSGRSVCDLYVTYRFCPS
jgi:hypothetical protein